MMKTSNTIYLYLHRILLLKAPPDKVMSRKRAIWIISKYFHFIRGLKVKALDDMVGLDLIVRLDKQKIKIINAEASKMIDSELFLTIIQSGDKIVKDDRAYWDSVDSDNEKLRDIIKEGQTTVNSVRYKLNDIKEKLDDIEANLKKITLPDQDEP